MVSWGWCMLQKEHWRIWLLEKIKIFCSYMAVVSCLAVREDLKNRVYWKKVGNSVVWLMEVWFIPIVQERGKEE